jgi:transcriptional regulator with XRE-family HTH domain
LLNFLTFVIFDKTEVYALTVFYENFLALCAKTRKTPSGVACAIGLSNAAASGWKKGKTPNDTTLLKIADYFGVSVETLTEDQKEKPVPSEEDELDNELIYLLTKLHPEEITRVTAYIQGILGSRNDG